MCKRIPCYRQTIGEKGNAGNLLYKQITGVFLVRTLSAARLSC